MATRKKTLWEKFEALLGSDRFWLLVAGGVLVGLQQNDWKLGAISALTAIVTVGTADKVADKVGGNQ